MSKAPQTFLKITIKFPKSPKYAKDRNELLKKLKAWIKDEKTSLSVKNIKYSRKSVTLSREEFYWQTIFRKQIWVFLAVRDPEKNIELANDFSNKILNYLKTILGESAFDAKINTEMEDYSVDVEGFAKKVIGASRLAKINEITKSTIDPIGVLFKYTKNERFNMLMAAGSRELEGEQNVMFILSVLSLKNTIPWDLVLTEHKEIKECQQIIAKMQRLEE